MVLLGNLATGRIAKMQSDYYWLEVTSCLFFLPLEAHHCRACEGCCVKRSSGSLPVGRNVGLLGNDATVKHTHIYTHIVRGCSSNKEMTEDVTW